MRKKSQRRSAMPKDLLLIISKECESARISFL
jgi:hypothetical protein